ncbi:uncharacterized protein LOC107462310 [Arachis duranensis]|uniref:Uncharacterized protein LOC107462310 n=1 Tax=Arachis duranensis TaxID=130453 RepID=A0A6P4BWG9_ARADU|nr:uncharacterized protein LOC107462310 [Arachis duranensis]
MGDFNEIVHIDERKGATGLSATAEDFRALINDMELVDLTLNNLKYTWFRGQSCSRIDRCLEEWIGLEDAQFLDKLKALSKPLGRWHKRHFRNIPENIKRFEDEINKVDDMVSNGVYDGTIEARRKALVRCCELWYTRKDIHWKQMSRSRHAKEMDRNTRYFHNIVSARRRNNKIESLVINGRLVRNHARIKVAIRDFYRKLFQQEVTPNISFRDGLVNRLGIEETQVLEMLPSEEEVKDAVWDCESSKTPGSDGYNMNFIKMCWDEIGVKFTKTVMTFFETAKLPIDSNITWVVLVPKFVGTKEIKENENEKCNARWGSGEDGGHGLENVSDQHLSPYWLTGHHRTVQDGKGPVAR